MQKIRLIHWSVTECAKRAARLRAAGYRVSHKPPDATYLRDLHNSPPAAVVVDLGRMPSHGRDIGAAIRSSKSLRNIPLVFVDGEAQKVKRVRALLPDAVYTTWPRIKSSLRRAVAHPPTAAVKTESGMAGYSGTPLPRKLGIKPGSVVALIGAPAGFEETLGVIPEEAQLRRNARGRRDLTIWFTKSRADLERRVARMAQVGGEGGLWIAWPKQASGVTTDLTQALVRKAGLDAGIVDHKIFAIDETWSGLRFAQRRR